LRLVRRLCCELKVPASTLLRLLLLLLLLLALRLHV
jgi:hypothetical protein